MKVQSFRMPAIIGAATVALLSACNPEPVSLNPAIQDIVAAVSEERMASSLRQLESFGTRHIASGNLAPQANDVAGYAVVLRASESHD